MDPDRPNPDALLASLQREHERARRGRLKIFFGMCPGVGKTYAMLRDARARHAAGEEVLIALAETHGRAETEALLEGLPLVPRVRLEHRGTTLQEMDLDAVLLWHPQLAVVDELAHTNAPGARHRKRYQDILELLEAGIDVYSAVNVQHIESRCEAVQQITGVPVRETVPDSLLDAADEIQLVDLTPTQLRARLAEGRVYLGDRAAVAAEHFFRESNLLALREMALRTVAEHVDRNLRDSMQAQRITGPWKSGDRLLVAVSASPFSEKLIRDTRRLAGTMEAPWLAVHIDTGTALTEPEQARLQKHLTLARQLGAEVFSTSGAHVGEALLRVASQHNATQLVLGKPLAGSWARRSPADWLIRHSGGLDVHLIPSNEGSAPGTRWRLPTVRSSGRDYIHAGAIVAVVTALCLGLLPWIGYWSVALLYLLAVVISAVRLPRGPIFFLGASSALLWNALFIPPRFTLAISHVHDWIMFLLYFVVALVAGHLTTRLRDRELAERKAEQRATELYRLTQAITASTSLAEAVLAVTRQIGEGLHAAAAVLLRDPSGLIAQPMSTFTLTLKEESVAHWCFQRQQPAGRFTDTLPEAEALHLPLLTGEQCEGVLAVRLTSVPATEQRDFLEAIASQLASFVQKERAMQSAREAQVAARSQKLQKALFDSVSHELKTPLAALAGLLEQPHSEPVELRLAVQRLTRTVNHLLDATRLESGLLRLNLEWIDPADLAREAIEAAGLPRDAVQLRALDEAAPISADAGLLGQAISMLLANAAAHSPAPGSVELHLAQDGGTCVVSVLDRGPGLAPGDEEKVFEKFYRGRGAKPGGLGLGLSIARQLVELHGGTLTARNRPEGGALFAIRLPAREQMKLPEEQLA